MTSGLDQKVQKDDGHRGRSALLKRLCSQDDQEESYESTSLKREEGEPFTLLLILASVVGHFIRKKICDAGCGDLVMVLKGLATTCEQRPRRVETSLSEHAAIPTWDHDLSMREYWLWIYDREECGIFQDDLKSAAEYGSLRGRGSCAKCTLHSHRRTSGVFVNISIPTSGCRFWDPCRTWT
ncbi:hypothetical protein NA56DRAFT_712741 [Hyaloscypha hepaticicola]|uniref:Uncharacterized protein n=1 Tax=Hyaloscypha hepaticicola TaxID=2082293 RepID=A0A2J6PFJ2_9HELO|nr:hypothetical protein NA56DRAFT_712741 [Hyaloscypha hepaticicola]